ncbi:pectin lyase-like protein [Crepidotus variabilis]|uniref:galacturonan 1,4-alpha-galacturonidase n=1 Tax=Crepidotus variabilis TaxID=179855 RepID=A0A9P6JI57_9AGAR|nr:pectin lyase-like protein [Crepidotus variabilis]
MKLSILPSVLATLGALAQLAAAAGRKACNLRPLGGGKDDTTQVEAAIASCGQYGTTVFDQGSYNITRKMKWDLLSSRVDLKGYLNFNPNIDYWMNSNNTYRAIFIQSLVATSSSMPINTGGIQGNGQKWWSYFANRTRQDGDGRPVALSLVNVTGGVVRNFRIESPPFWANAVSQSSNVTYDGMLTNATNTDPLWAGQNVTPNTDGINTYRSDFVTLRNWDITCGDDCLAIKGPSNATKNSSDVIAHNITCRGGNGLAFGSLGQYAELVDTVRNVDLKDIFSPLNSSPKMTRIDKKLQPNMRWGIYFKSWSGSISGTPPTGGGGGSGYVRNVTVRNVVVDQVDAPIFLHHNSGSIPSKMTYSNVTFSNFTGTATTNKIVELSCGNGPACTDITFEKINVTAPAGLTPQYICSNAADIKGLSGSCSGI